MLNKISRKLKKYATGWLVFFLFLLDGFYMGYLMPSIGASLANASGNTGPLDLMFFYTPQTAYEMVANYGDYRSTYRVVELTVDIVYPIVYTLFFSLLLTWLFNKNLDAESKIQKLNILPFGAGLFDLLENLGIVTMLSVYPSTPAIVAWITTIFTMAKWSFLGVSILLMIIGTLVPITKLFRKNKRHHHRSKSHHNTSQQIR